MLWLNATATAAELVVPDCHAPVSSSTIALIVDVMNDTMNTSITAFSPCCTGCLLAAVP
jgi:hypothetical protein